MKKPVRSRIERRTMQRAKDNDMGMDRNKFFGFFLILAGLAGGTVALVYAWTIQMMLRHARHDLLDGIWALLICFAVLLLSVLVGYLGRRLWRKSAG
jgi:hypothetical protein